MLDLPTRLSSPLQGLLQTADQIATDLERLARLSGHQAKLDRIDDGWETTSFVSSVNDHYWSPLSQEGLIAQLEVARAYKRFCELAAFALHDAIPPRQERFRGATYTVLALIHQDAATRRSIEEHLSRALGALKDQKQQLLDHSASTRNFHRIHVVPDTSALLDSPELGSFGVPGYLVGVVLLPVVLDELDRLKDSARRAEAKTAAQSVIRQIAKLRSDGHLLQPRQVKPEVIVVAVGMEPRSQDYPRVLNPEIDDDRFVAGALAFSAQHLSETTIISTSDINMANKAAMVGIQSVPAPSPNAEGSEK